MNVKKFGEYVSVYKKFDEFSDPKEIFEVKISWSSIGEVSLKDALMFRDSLSEAIEYINILKK